jgi:bifunctional UDP-N-acetylglucosamine pyrophosphorylase/glucosamine-1-phosphate N-acetyltransferase
MRGTETVPPLWDNLRVSSSLDIVILAAGQGKRMHSSLPKVLHPLAGWPLLAHVIAAAQALNPRRICIVYGHGGEQVAAAFAADGLTWVKQELQLGTGHALLQALPHLSPKGTTLVLYGDVPLIQPDTLRAMIANDRQLTLLTVQLADPHGYGRIVRNAKKQISKIVEEKDATPKQRVLREVNSGIMAIPAAKLAGWLKKISNRNAQGEYYLTDIVALALKDRVKIGSVAPHHGPWEILGVNDQQQLVHLERIHQLRVAERLLAAGVALADPSRLDVRGTLTCGRDVRIDINALFEGEVALGDGVTIGAHCVIRNATIGAGTRIEPFTHIDGADIGAHCNIGPYARLRPGTEIATEAHVGNFVEIKNSHLGAHSKANHLSYLGDTDLGRNVNVGAGTITCNYDGANKHRTVIEDDVFIGSDTQLIAPVTVKRGATIGAGSTITADAPADALTLSRAPQTTVAGWRRPQKKAAEGKKKGKG